MCAQAPATTQMSSDVDFGMWNLLETSSYVVFTPRRIPTSTLAIVPRTERSIVQNHHVEVSCYVIVLNINHFNSNSHFLRKLRILQKERIFTDSDNLLKHKFINGVHVNLLGLCEKKETKDKASYVGKVRILRSGSTSGNRGTYILSTFKSRDYMWESALFAPTSPVQTCCVDAIVHALSTPCRFTCNFSLENSHRRRSRWYIDVTGDIIVYITRY